ncbi:MAG: hypothetical protein HRT71_02915 [Flavobacteriales bacterium]|nr:hypothetical protein [Flavobacteriales bacterium]
MSQVSVYSQAKNTPTGEAPIKVSKTLLAKMVDDVKYCVLQAKNERLTEPAREGYLKNLAYVTSDLFEIKDMPRKLKGATKAILDKGTSNVEAMQMAADYYLEKLNDEKTLPYLVKKYEARFDRLQEAIDDHTNSVVRYDAHHAGSTVASFGASYLGEGYTPPFLLNIDRALTSKISAGIYIKHFTETKRNNTNPEDYEPSDSLPDGWANHFDEGDDKNYWYNYYSIGIRATYHLNDVVRSVINYNPKRWDVYATVIGGYTLTSDPNDLAKITDSLYMFSPTKDGVNYGLMIGTRFMIDNNMGVFLEAGYENIGFASAGFSYRFLQEDKKKKKK